MFKKLKDAKAKLEAELKQLKEQIQNKQDELGACEMAFQKRTLIIDRDLFEKEQRALRRLLVVESQILEDVTTHEHEYHYGLQIKNTELAKLDAQIEIKQELMAIKDTQIEKNEEQIKQLLETIKCTVEYRSQPGINITK